MLIFCHGTFFELRSFSGSNAPRNAYIVPDERDLSDWNKMYEPFLCFLLKYVEQRFEDRWLLRQLP